jgi:hypothetical protein
MLKRRSHLLLLLFSLTSMAPTRGQLCFLELNEIGTGPARNTPHRRDFLVGKHRCGIELNMTPFCNTEVRGKVFCDKTLVCTTNVGVSATKLYGIHHKVFRPSYRRCVRRQKTVNTTRHSPETKSAWAPAPLLSMVDKFQLSMLLTTSRPSNALMASKS